MAFNVLNNLHCNLSAEQKKKIQRILYIIYSIITVGFFVYVMTLEVNDFGQDKTNISVDKNFTDASAIASLYICPDTNDVFMKDEYEMKEKKSLDMKSEPSLEQVLSIDKILDFTPNESDLIEACEMRDENLLLNSYSKVECNSQFQITKSVTSGSVCYNLKSTRTTVAPLSRRGLIGFDPRARRILESITLNSKLFKNVKKMFVFYALKDQMPVEEFITAPLIDREYDNVTGQYRYSQFSIRYSMENTTYLEDRLPYCKHNTDKYEMISKCLQNHFNNHLPPYGFYTSGNQTILAASTLGSEKGSKKWLDIYEGCEDDLKGTVECIDRRLYNYVDERSKSDKIKIVTLLPNQPNQFWTHTAAKTWKDLWDSFVSNAGAFLGLSIIGLFPFFFNKEKWDETTAHAIPTMIAAVAAAKWLSALRRKKEEEEERDPEAGGDEQENIGDEVHGSSSFGDQEGRSNQVRPGRVAFSEIVNQARNNELKKEVDDLNKRFKDERDGLQTWRDGLEKRLNDLSTNQDSLMHFLNESVSKFRPQSPSTQPGPSTSEPEVTEQRVREIMSEAIHSGLSSIDLKIRQASQQSGRRLDMADERIKELGEKQDEWREHDLEKFKEVKEALLIHRREIDALNRTPSTSVSNEVKQRLDIAEAKLEELETELNQWKGMDSKKLEQVEKDLTREINAIRQLALKPTPPQNDLEPAMDALTKKVEELAEKVTSVNPDDISSLRLAVDGVNDRLVITTQNLDAWKSQYENAMKQSYSMQALDRILSELDDKILTTDDKSRRRFTDMNDLLNEHKLAQHSELEENVEELSSRLDRGIANLTRWQENFDNRISILLANGKKDQEETSGQIFTGLTQRLVSVNDRLEVLEGKPSVDEQLTKLKIKALEQAIVSLEQTNQSQHQSIHSLEQRIGSLEQTNLSQDQSIWSQNMAIVEMKRLVQQQAHSFVDQRLEAMAKRLDVLAEEKSSDDKKTGLHIANLEHTIHSQQDEIRSQQNEIRFQREAIQSLQLQFQSAEERLVQKQAKIVTELQNNLRSKDQELDKLRNRLDNVDKTFKTHDDVIRSQNESMAETKRLVQQQVEAMAKRLDVLTEEKSSVDKKTGLHIANLEQTIHSQQNEIRSQQNEIRSQQEATRSQFQSVEELKRLVKQQAESVTKLQEDLHAKDRELTKLGKDYKIIQQRKGAKSVQNTKSKASQTPIGAEGGAKDTASDEEGSNEPSMMVRLPDDDENYMGPMYVYKYKDEIILIPKD